MSTPVVLVHGLGGSPASWGRVVPLLAPHAGPIIAPALIGEGAIGAEADRSARRLATRRGPPAGRGGPLAWNLMPRAVAAKGLAGAFAPGTTVPEVFVDDLRNTGLPAFLRSSRAIDTYLNTQTLPARLAALACPTQLLFGLQDQRVDP